VKAKEDPEIERKTGEWIEDVLGRALQDTSDLYKSLKNGVALCELVNKIYPGLIRKYNKEVPGQEMHVLRERVCMEWRNFYHSGKHQQIPRGLLQTGYIQGCPFCYQ
jgi:hypothetical protein